MPLFEATFQLLLSNKISIVSVSDSVETWLGFSVDSFISGNIQLKDRIHTGDNDISNQLFSTGISTPSGSFNLRIRKKNGHICCVKATYTKKLDDDTGVILDLLLQDAKSLYKELAHPQLITNFKAVMENTDDYIYFKDRNHVFTGASETLVSLTESFEHWTDLLGLTDYDVFPEQYADSYYELEERVFSGEHLAHKEQETLDTEGNKGWVDNRKYPIQNESGEIIGLFGIARDITAQRQIQYQLEKSESRLKETQRYAHLAHWDIFPGGKAAIWSEQVQAIFGLPAGSESSPELLCELLHKDDYDAVMTSLQYSLATGKEHHIEYRITRQNDGEQRWIECRGKAVLNKDGAVEKLSGFIQDITERKLGQLATEKLLAEQSVILDNSLVGIVTARDRRIIWANKAFETLLGYQQGELLGRPTRQVYAKEEDYQSIGAAYAKIKATGIIKNELEFLCKDSRHVWVDMRGSALNEKQGESLWVVVDVTERKLSELALSKAKEKYRTLFEASNDAIVVFDGMGFIDANTAALGLFGCSSFDILRGKSPADVSPETQPNGEYSATLAQQHIATAIKQGKHQFEWVHKRTDNNQPFSADILISASEIAGKIVIQATVRDITQQKRTQFYENIQHQVWDLLYKHAPLTILLESIINIVESTHPNIVCSILLLDKDKKHLLMGAAPHLPDFYKKAIDGIKVDEGIGSCGTAVFTQQRVIVEDIQTHPYWESFKDVTTKANLKACWSEPIMGSHNKVLGTFEIYHHEISSPEQKDFELIEFSARLVAIAIERSQTNERLLMLSNVFTNTHEGITITDKNKRIIDINPAFTEITGYKREEVIGKNPGLLSSGKQSPEFYAEMWQQLDKQGYWQGEVWNRHKEGEIYAELLNISTLLDEKGDVTNYVGVFSDITQSKQQQEKINLMAHYDVLTGLPNRALFVDRFHQAIAHSHRTSQQLAVCFLDLDNFKPVNDNYGHEVGDQLLIEVAQRITATIREEDTVSRQGGDEFALLLNDIAYVEQCEQTLERIHHTLVQPYIIDGHSHKISASCGVTLYPNDQGDIDTLLRHADQAMYQAKQAGRNHYQFFNTKQNQAITLKQHQLSEIEHALDNNEFQLFYQPKVNMKTGEVYGAEALIRWIHPEKGLIPPLEFLPLVDGADLEIKIGDWVINQAILQLDKWQQQGINLEVSINISSTHLLSAGFIKKFDAALLKYPSVNSQTLQLEILESSALGDLNTIINIIKICKQQLGLTFSLDDFGTGYSSLTHLRNLPVNTIKIDQSFVRDMLDDSDDYVIIDGVIALADSFNREVIAEGVETTNHGLMLLIMGCERAQGYGISKPIPADTFLSWLNNYTPNQEWLSFSSKQRTVKENKIKLYRLVSERWKNLFISNMQSAPQDMEVCPIMDMRCCHCSYWIHRARQEQLFEEKWQHRLEQAHEKIHNIAHELLVKYQQADFDGAVDGIAEFNLAFESMSNILGLCE
ncbi:MAG: PAS domain S-box protein [Methylococcales bacterium]